MIDSPQQGTEDFQGFAPTYPNIQANINSLQYQIDSEKIIKQIEANLLCIEPYLDAKTGQIKHRQIEGVEPFVSPSAVKKAIVILRSRLNQIFILSDLDDAVIDHQCLITGKIIIEDMFYNWKDYEIDKSGARILLHTITDCVHATLRKGRNAKYLQFLGTTHSSNEIQHFQNNKPQGENASFWSRLINKK